jgi:hypothetical protein
MLKDFDGKMLTIMVSILLLYDILVPSEYSSKSKPY